MLLPMHASLVCFSAISFIGFGMACFFWHPMRAEYARYGVPQFRALVGSLQIAGGLGLLAGFAFPPIGYLAAAGLALMMFCGVGIRIRIKDGWIQTFPAVFYLALNIYLVFAAFQ
jgi:hypothetical protein